MDAAMKLKEQGRVRHIGFSTHGSLKTILDTINDGRFEYVNLVGATADDARDIMIEGESGILAVCRRDEKPDPELEDMTRRTSLGILLGVPLLVVAMTDMLVPSKPIVPVTLLICWQSRSIKPRASSTTPFER